MRTNNPSDDDTSLRGLLREWKVKAPVPPRFQEGVWRRIEREEIGPADGRSPWSEAIRKWLADFLPRPALAVAYLIVLLAAGAGVGWTQAQHERARVNSQLSEQYVHVLDPFLNSH